MIVFASQSRQTFLLSDSNFKVSISTQSMKMTPTAQFYLKNSITITEKLWISKELPYEGKNILNCRMIKLFLLSVCVLFVLNSIRGENDTSSDTPTRYG